MTASNSHISEHFLQYVIKGKTSADPSMVAFRNPNNFRAGQLHIFQDQWENLLSANQSEKSGEILSWITNKVEVSQYFRHFNGQFKGENYNCPKPPSRLFANHPSCKQFTEFISRAILERLSTGAISLWGKVGVVDPPHLVMPLTVEPNKPRLCNDKRFLNLWMVDKPFKLDTLPDVPRYVSKDSFQSITDDKSGYDHVLLTNDSKTYFDFQWAGWYFVSNTIPFGWKLSAHVYHTIGSSASHYFRSLGIPCSLYIDDRHIGQLAPP
ncbi:hypothetical protein QZH41_007602 [Actinostola sp. cb2023]|nr:hypothetical protein QZH41_007602 [Actinostola sp. cb2023]